MRTEEFDHFRHVKLVEAKSLVENKRMSRREFVRISALLGASIGAASSFIGLTEPGFADEHQTLPFGPDNPEAKKGGTLRVAMKIQPMEDPATYSWVQMSNQTRHMNEHLTFVGPDNVARPMLAEAWEASDDLKRWTFSLRKGVKWHNGDEFTADHVIFNFRRWMDPDIQSSNVGLSTIAAMLEDQNGKRVAKENAIEKLDDYTIQLNLVKPVLSVPEDLYHYGTALLHPSFVPPLSDNPLGTGPFKLVELTPGQSCKLERVTHTADGDPFEYWGGTVYLDAIHYLDANTDQQLALFAARQVDTIYEFSADQFSKARQLDGTVLAAKTAQAGVCRMQITQAPFDNPLVRQAINKCIDSQTFLSELFGGRGEIGENHHVSPIHPEYFPLETQSRDVEGAKALLKQAGYEKGLDLTIDVGNTSGSWEHDLCLLMKKQLADADIRLDVNLVPAETYWNLWLQTAFGLTSWAHRPLGTMCLSLAYRTGVPWNETRFSSLEFDEALDKAETLLDVEERRIAMENVERILQANAIIVQPVWRPVFTIQAHNIHGIAAHPTQFHQFNKVWIDA